MICTQTQTSETDSAATSLIPVGEGRMWVDRRFQPHLVHSGLHRFEDVMRTSAGRCMRVLPDRENWYLPARACGDAGQGFYLKKHHVRTWRSRLRAWLRWRPAASAGRVEAENVAALGNHGVGVMNIVAYGEKLCAGGLLESFVISEELAGYLELDKFLRRRFAPRRLRVRRACQRDLLELIRRVAGVTRRLHAAGYNHRDLYCCHFFIREPGRGEFDVRLIDLQRVQRRRWFRRRWLVKDLAQLAWSTPRERISCTQKMAFIRAYLGVRKLRPADKRLIREVLAKQQVMERRLGIEA